jgi:hypothetical protein
MVVNLIIGRVAYAFCFSFDFFDFMRPIKWSIF